MGLKKQNRSGRGKVKNKEEIVVVCVWNSLVKRTRGRKEEREGYRRNA